MRNITFDEWKTEIGKVAEQIRLRWPWLRVESDHQELSVRVESCSGGVCLRGVTGGGERHMVPHAMLLVSSTLASDTRVARSQVLDATTVCDALDVATALLDRFQVWLPGRCPCDSCSGRGESRGRKCDDCNGGVR